MKKPSETPNRIPGSGFTKQEFALIERLSLQSREAIKALVLSLCHIEGVNVPLGPAEGLQSLAEGIPLWQAWLVSRGYAPRSITLYRYCIRRHLERDPDSDTLSIEKHFSTRLLAGTSPTTIHNEYKALKSFFGYLFDRGLWPTNPMRRVAPPKVPRRERKVPSLDEVLKLIAAIDTPKLGAMLYLFLDTGIRFSELSHLRWSDIDFENHAITVIGKGNKERTIPISPITVAVLQNVKNGNGDPNDLVFPSSRVEGWKNTNANKMIARLCRKAGIPKYTCHQFRHFFATYTLEQGGDLKAVSVMLGHAHASTTVDFYLHTDEKKIRKAHDRHSPLVGMGG